MTTLPETGGRAASRSEPRLSAFFSPITDPGQDADRAHLRELDDELDAEQAGLRRQVILGQRAGRCIIAVVAALIASTSGSAGRTGTLLLLACCVTYFALVVAVPVVFSARAGRSPRSERFLAPAQITADLLVVGAIFAVTQPPQLAYVLLLVAPLLVWVAGFYFSWRLATYAAIGAAAIYVGMARYGAPQWQVPLTVVIANLAAFAVVVVILTLELARYRARVDVLRLFCRQVGEGDVGLRLPFMAPTTADDLTALGQSIDSMRKRLAEQIGVDALTGCLNRRALESRLRGEWRLAKRRGGMIGLLAVDLDHFKEINDTHGHAVGDTVLQQLAGIMRGVARESDVVARLGGDEFVMVLPDTETEGAHVVAERLREHVAAFEFGTRDKPIRATVSVGVASAHGRDAISTPEILASADRSLYASKQAGRNQVSVGR